MMFPKVTKILLSSFARVQKNGAKSSMPLDISVKVSFFCLIFPFYFVLIKVKINDDFLTAVDDFVFALGGWDAKNEETLGKIERFNVKLKVWETLRIEMPEKIRSVAAILSSDGILHCIGGKNEKKEATDSRFQIPLTKIYQQNVGFRIFENMFRKCGFKGYTQDIGKIIEDYVGNVM